MSSYKRRLYRQAIRDAIKAKRANNVFKKPQQPIKKYSSFNIFTRQGENRLDVKSPYPMTIDEAQVYFDALSIGPNE